MGIFILVVVLLAASLGLCFWWAKFSENHKDNKIVIGINGGIVAILVIGLGYEKLGCGKNGGESKDSPAITQMSDPKAVAQMAIDSIMKEDYQLYRKVLDPQCTQRLGNIFPEKSIQGIDDIIKESYDEHVRLKHRTMFLSGIAAKVFKKMECKLIKVDNIEGKLKTGEKGTLYEGRQVMDFYGNVKLKIINYSLQPDYSWLQVPEHIEFKYESSGSFSASPFVRLWQLGDGTWRVCTERNAFDPFLPSDRMLGVILERNGLSWRSIK